MDDLTTPYEDDSATEFIECSVCEISLRGHNLYKIHLTMPGHLKKEDAAVATGLMVREQTVPKYKDILQYVEYLKLDEPIIGLNLLEEVPSVNADHPSMGPRYTCTLCNITAYSPEMVHHVIGRKHRQKYIETKRPDLVTWDKHSVMNQVGKIIRTRAEIIARQDGSGRPMPMKKMNVGNLMSRVPPWQRQNRHTQNDSSLYQRNQDFQDSHRSSLMPHPLRKAPFLKAEAHPMYAAGGRPTTNPWDQQLERADDWERGPSRGKSSDLDYRLDDTVDPSKKTQRGWDQSPEGYPTYREQETKNEFFSEDVRPEFQPQRRDYQPHRPDYQPHRPDYQPQHRDSQPHPPVSQPHRRDSQPHRRDPQPQRPDYQPQRPDSQRDDQLWSSDKDRVVRLGSSVPEPPMRDVRSSLEQPAHLFRDYRHGLQQAEPLSAGPNSFQTPRVDSPCLSTIPEPFRRFMDGAAGDEAPSRRKRKSRFSDATAEEVEVANKKFNAGPPDAKFIAPNSAGETFLQGIRVTMRHPDRFAQSQLSSPTPQQMSAQHSYGRTFQDDSNFRRAEDVYGEEGNRGGRDRTKTHDSQRVYQQQGRREHGDSIRKRYEEGFGQQQMYPTRRPDERAQRPERFQGGGRQQQHFQQRDVQQVSQGGFHSRSPPLDTERSVGMHQRPQYSKSLEKLTSTLLEFMSRN
ncbi:uncharacterized protein si:ch211-13c6.2 isoform X1 [Phycodurus eques]|uniref:uncharacterized protein si:ch211-13c6.2 isoform X1 n=2 Tax=Phycodurus eques TaxID=693459 RepID=UPI002ACE7A4C|nr:uncharacterized protein si:ch211-13c6.2 isoform X1 [Phycodurus eques]